MLATLETLSGPVHVFHFQPLSLQHTASGFAHFHQVSRTVGSFAIDHHGDETRFPLPFLLHSAHRNAEFWETSSIFHILFNSNWQFTYGYEWSETVGVSTGVASEFDLGSTTVGCRSQWWLVNQFRFIGFLIFRHLLHRNNVVIKRRTSTEKHRHRLVAGRLKCNRINLTRVQVVFLNIIHKP